MSDGFGIYVHTPWCKSRCPYCAFNVVVSPAADYRPWLSGISSAWVHSAAAFQGKAHSLYFGGGTPSLAPPSILAQIIESMPLSDQAEVTVEANPGSIDSGGLCALADAGVNRLSIGVQTFNPEHARRLGRGHTVHQANALLQRVSTLGFMSWSMDLMFGLPDQTLHQVEEDLDVLLSFAPPHVSLYGLSIEPSTPFKAAQQAGNLRLPEGDLWREMYDCIVETLETAGLERYEVSNFAQPGHRAVQNEQVWRGGHYAGLGPGAHGFLPSGARTVSHPDLEQWFSNPDPQQSIPSQHEAAIDFILSTLRHTDGLCTKSLREQTGFGLNPARVQALTNHGVITCASGYICLSHDAFPVADGIVRAVIEALEAAQHP
jgi:putative oxygen-independent coproporphyrinogen III oxidase